MREEYEKPEMTVLSFGSDVDIIVTSVPGEDLIPDQIWFEGK